MGSIIPDRNSYSAVASAAYGKQASGTFTDYLYGAKPKLPAAPPPPPDLADELANAASEEERRKILAQRGRQSTFLTGPAGDTTTPTTGQKTLLGG